MDKERQFDLFRSYMKNWQPQTDDPSYIIADIYRKLLEKNEVNANRMMEFHRDNVYEYVPLPPMDIQPFSYRICMRPFTTVDCYALSPKEKVYLQCENLYLMELEKALFLQHTKIIHMVSYIPEKEEFKVYNAQAELSLFDSRQKNDQCFSFGFHFQNIFHYMHHPIFELYINGRNDVETIDILHLFTSSKFIFMIYIDEVAIRDVKIVLKEHHLEVTLPYDFNDLQHTIYFEFMAKDPLHIPVVIIKEVYLYLPKRKHLLNQVIQNEIEQKCEGFSLFEAPLSLFQSTYLRCDAVFSRLGAKITWKFHMEKKETITGEVPDEPSYHLFMRKLPKQQKIYEVQVDRVQLEYFHGEWSTLSNTSSIATFFKSDQEYFELNFTCPNDMQLYTMGGIESYWLRLTLVKAEDCYMVPARHFIPYLKENRMIYDYEDTKFYPNKMIAKSNGIVTSYKQGSEFHLFSKRLDKHPCVYFCLDDTIQDKPLHLYVTIKQTSHHVQDVSFYNCLDEHHRTPISVDDETDGFMHSGFLTFHVSSYMKKSVQFGIEGYWLVMEYNQQEPNPIHIMNIDYNSALIRYCWKEIQYATLTPNTYNYTIELTAQENCELFEVYVKEEQGHWVQWEYSKRNMYKQRCMYFHEKEKQLLLNFACMDNINIVDEEDNIKIVYRTYVTSIDPDDQTTLFLAEQNSKIEEIQLMDVRHADMQKEPRAHYLQRIQHRFQHRDQLRSVWDIETSLKDSFLEIERVKVIYDKKLCVYIVWKNQRTSTAYHLHKKTSIQHWLQERLPDRVKIEVLQPIFIHVHMYLESPSTFHKEELRCFIQDYFDMYKGNTQHGWEIGEYPNMSDVLHRIKQEFLSIDITRCKMYGSAYIDGVFVYKELKQFQSIPYGIIHRAYVEI